MAALCVLLSAACVFDYRKRKIPNWLIACILALGTGQRFFTEGIAGGLYGFAGMFCIIVMLYPFFKIGALGAGDIKLLGAASMFLPFQRVFIFLFVSLLIAAGVSLIKLWREKNGRERIQFFLRYIRDCSVAGVWKPYLTDRAERHRLGVCLSGPILASALLYMGGVY